jgi:hypothetical protein
MEIQTTPIVRVKYRLSCQRLTAINQGIKQTNRLLILSSTITQIRSSNMVEGNRLQRIESS